VAVVYNGEIYNYRPLRTELEAAGHCFATHTDTEVIVHGYEEWGLGVLDRLRGMFAIGLWDAPRGQLLLARDRLGEKPLYFARYGGGIRFASEIKALLEDTAFPRRVNPDALPFYLALGYAPPPHTMFAGIEKLAPGEYLLVSADGIRQARYWTPVMDTLSTSRVAFADCARRLRALLTEAVEMRLMSDVPLGAYLSGGVDSTAIVALMSRALGRPVQTFTVGFDFRRGERMDEKFNVDARFAALAAARLKTDHHVITLRHDDRLAWLLPHLVYAMDEPVSQTAVVQTVHVAALARASGVPVLLSGDASDELFAGYPSYRADRVLERYLHLPRLLRQTALTPILEHLPTRFDRLRKLAAKSRDTDPVSRYLTWMHLIELERLPALLPASQREMGASTRARLAAMLGPLLSAPRTRNFADRIAFASLSWWIPEDSNMRVDKMSMAMSVESRAPFEDHLLVDFALRLPLALKLRGGDFKAVLKHAVADLVPREILSRPKWGFFPPASEWLRTSLRPLVETHLAPERVAAAGWFDPGAVGRLLDSHIMQHHYELWPLWTLLMFHIWYALYIDGSLTLSHRLQPADLLSEVTTPDTGGDTPLARGWLPGHPHAGGACQDQNAPGG
jgi:asparagine synthase (glutamine-hydrolysing)